MSTTNALESNELFLKGEELLKAKSYSKAIQVFQDLRQQGFTTPSLENNLGLALTENGMIADGLFHLGLATYLARGDKTLESNLHFAQTRIEGDWGTRMSHPAEFFVKIDTRIRSEELLFGALFFLLLFLYAFVRPSVFLNKIRTACLALSLVSVFFALGTLAFNQSIAISNKVTEVKELPIVSELPKATLPVGARFRVIQIRDGYAEIERPGKVRGWIDQGNATFVAN